MDTHYFANLLIGALNENVLSQAYLISIKEPNKKNNKTISHFINDGFMYIYFFNPVQDFIDALRCYCSCD